MKATRATEQRDPIAAAASDVRRLELEVARVAGRFRSSTNGAERERLRAARAGLDVELDEAKTKARALRLERAKARHQDAAETEARARGDLAGAKTAFDEARKAYETASAALRRACDVASSARMAVATIEAEDNQPTAEGATA